MIGTLKTIKRLTALAVALLLGICGLNAQNNLHQIKMMTYNIRGHEIINSRQLTPICNVIKHAAADVVAIQEVDQKWVKDCAAQLGEKTGMKSRFLVTHGKNFGIVLLSKVEPMGIKTHLIPKGSGGGSAKPDPDDNRGVIIAEFEDYFFLCTHYSLNADDRDVATAYIIDFAKTAKKPVFLGGDLNMKENYRAMNTFKNAGFKILNNTSVYTYPADAPADCIDFILGYNQSSISYKTDESGIASMDGVKLSSLSDHLPVFVKVSLAEATDITEVTSKLMPLEKRGDKYVVGVEGKWQVKVFALNGSLLLNVETQEGDILPFSLIKEQVVMVQLKNGNNLFTQKVML